MSKRLYYVDKFFAGAAFLYAWLLLPILLCPPHNPEDNTLIGVGFVQWLLIALACVWLI